MLGEEETENIQRRLK